MIALVLLMFLAEPAAEDPYKADLIEGVDTSSAKFDADMATLCYRDPDCVAFNREGRDRAISAYGAGTEKVRKKILKAIAQNTTNGVVSWRWVPSVAGLDPKVRPSQPYSSGYRRGVTCTSHVSKNGRHAWSHCW